MTNLYVDVVTDHVPFVEFSTIEVERVSDIDPMMETYSVTTGADFSAGVRVARFFDVAPGSVELRVRLLAFDGSLVQERRAVVNAVRDTVVPLLIARSCRHVSCPGPSDERDASACIGGRCVPVECSPATPEHCPMPQCRVPADCPASQSSCAERDCERGVCTLRGRPDGCTAPELCHPLDGCVAPDPEGPSIGVLVPIRTFVGPGDVAIEDLHWEGTENALIVGGNFDTETDLGGGIHAEAQPTAFVGRYDAEGAFQWSSLVPGVSIHSVSALNGVVLAAGDARRDDLGGSDSWIGAFSLGDGTVLREARFVGLGRSLTTALEIENATSCITGADESRVDFSGVASPSSAAASSPFLACFDTSTGEYRWSLEFDEVEGTGRGLALSDETLTWVGNVTGSVDFGGGESAASERSSPFVARYRLTDGAYIGSRVWDAEGRATSVAYLTNGDLVVGGTFQGVMVVGDGHELSASGNTSAGFVVVIDRMGAVRWAATLDGSERDAVSDIVTTGDALYVVGNYLGAMSDMVLRSYSAEAGDAGPRLLMGGLGDDFVRSAVRGSRGSLFLSGVFGASIGAPPLTHHANVDSFLLRVDAP